MPELAAPRERAGSTSVEVRTPSAGLCSRPHGHAVSAAQRFLPQLCPGTWMLSRPLPRSPRCCQLIPRAAGDSQCQVGRDTFPLPFPAWVEGGQRGLAGGCLAQRAPVGHFQVLLLLPAKYKPQ